MARRCLLESYSEGRCSYGELRSKGLGRLEVGVWVLMLERRCVFGKDVGRRA